MQGLKMCPRCYQSTAAMGSDHQPGRGQGTTWFLKDFKADQSKRHYRGSATAACLLIHSLQIQKPPGFPFASFLHNLFLPWSSRLLHHCGLGLSLNIIFMLAHSVPILQLQTPEPGQQTQQEFVPIGAWLLQHQEDLQLLGDIMWQL